MPPRWLCLLIVAFWVSSTGWLLWRDLLPQVLPGQPPPYTIDPTEEAETKRAVTSWALSQDGREVCVARTRVEHPGRGVFEFVADYPLRGSDPRLALAAAVVGACSDSPLASLVVAACAVPRAVSPASPPAGRFEAAGLRVLGLSTTYRLDADGHVLGFEARFRASPEALGEVVKLDFTGTPSGPFDAAVLGEIDGHRLTLTREVTRPGREPARAVAVAETAAGRGGAILLPLHPVKRMRGIAPGQAWRTLVVDPFAVFLAGQPRVVRAKVRPAVEPFAWGQRGEVPCLVIDYEGERVKVITWVRRDDGAILCQEATLDRTRWVMTRH